MLPNLEKAMAPHSSTPVWRIPWVEEPGGLQSIGLQTVGRDCVTKHTKAQQQVLSPGDAFF